MARLYKILKNESIMCVRLAKTFGVPLIRAKISFILQIRSFYHAVVRKCHHGKSFPKRFYGLMMKAVGFYPIYSHKLAQRRACKNIHVV